MMRTLMILGGVSAGLYFGSRYISQSRRMARCEKTVSDQEGNYDIDGVSFDPASRVVVSGDSTTPDPRHDSANIERLVKLHSA